MASGGRPGRPEGPLDPAAGGVANLAASLRKLREEAGRPSYRQLAELAFYSHTALSQAAAGRELPSLPVTLAFVQACGGDREEWTERWHEAAGSADSSGPAGDAGPEVDASPETGTRPEADATPVAVRSRGWCRPALTGLIGATAGVLAWVVASLIAVSPAPHPTVGVSAPATAGDYSSAAGCGSPTEDLGGRRVMDGSGHLLGTLELQWSLRCGIVLARFDPSRQALASAGTVTVTIEVVRHPAGQYVASRVPYAGYLSRSDILQLNDGCEEATVTLVRAGQTKATASTACQPPP